MSVIEEMTALLERQKATPVLGTPSMEKPTRKGAFKVSASALKFFKSGGIDPKDVVFKQEKAIIDKIPRQDLPKIFGKEDMSDAQDFLAAKPKKAFQMWMREVGKVEPKVKKMLQRVPQNAPLWFYLFMIRISGQMMADEIFKRHFYSKDTGHPGELKRKKKEESMGLPKDWRRIAGIENTYRGFEDALHEESDYDQIKAYLDKEMTPIKTKGIRASWWVPGKAWALNLPFQGAQIHTFTILPLFPGKKAYRPADPDRGIPEGIILNPTWHGAKDFDRTMAQIEKAVDLIKHKSPSLEDAVDSDIKWIEQKFSIKVPPAVVARIKKGLESMAKRRWDVNMLRQYGQLYPFDGGKPFKLDSWGSLKR